MSESIASGNKNSQRGMLAGMQLWQQAASRAQGGSESQQGNQRAGSRTLCETSASARRVLSRDSCSCRSNSAATPPEGSMHSERISARSHATAPRSDKAPKQLARQRTSASSSSSNRSGGPVSVQVALHNHVHVLPAARHNTRAQQVQWNGVQPRLLMESHTQSTAKRKHRRKADGQCSSTRTVRAVLDRSGPGP